MRDLLRQVLDVLVLAGAVCGLLLFAAAVVGFMAAVIRVTILGRVLVIPFRGTDERRVEITGLFARRLMEIEERCTRLAREIRDLKAQFVAQSERALPLEAQRDDVLARGDALSSDLTDSSHVEALTPIGAAPRTADELIDDILLLDETASVSNADLGVVSVAGVSFSPQSILALLRALPAVFARRLLSGSIVRFGETALFSVSYQEGRLGRQSRAVSRRTEVEGENWLPAIEDLAFSLAKGRIEMVRAKAGRGHARQDGPLAVRVSEMADRATVEATSWAAGEAFLNGYVAHLRHYVSGQGADRDRALRCYETAVQAQPGYTRAIYHRATLLYNRYLPDDNAQAIAGFQEAAASDDTRLRALSYAGLAMAYCQSVHRFGEVSKEVIHLARTRASNPSRRSRPWRRPESRLRGPSRSARTGTGRSSATTTWPPGRGRRPRRAGWRRSRSTTRGGSGSSSSRSARARWPTLSGGCGTPCACTRTRSPTTTSPRSHAGTGATPPPALCSNAP